MYSSCTVIGTVQPVCSDAPTHSSFPEVIIKDPAYEDQINPKENSLICLDYAVIYDDNFIQNYKQATLHADSKHRTVALKALKDELAPPSTSVNINYRELRILEYFDNLCDDDSNDLTTLQSVLDATPFRELILQSIPVKNIRVEPETIMWHQRLGRPCDVYLYSAHKFIDIVPKFKQRSHVLSKCSKCIKANMARTDPVVRIQTAALLVTLWISYGHPARNKHAG